MASQIDPTKPVDDIPAIRDALHAIHRRELQNRGRSGWQADLADDAALAKRYCTYCQ